jgi:glycopeptide antibiotics resistance protein
MYDFGPLEWLIGFICLAVILIIFWRRKRNPWYLLAFSVFGVYLLLLVSVVIFPIPPQGSFWPSEQEAWRDTLQRINWIPFQYNIPSDEFFNYVIMEIVNNVLMTVPFGFGLNFLARLNLRKVAWLAVLLGISTEIAQLIVSLLIGAAYRTVDMTDVILNALGTLLGYALFRLFAWLYRHGLGAFVDDVMRRA